MKVGAKVPVYTDPSNNLGYEGDAELIEYIGEGLPFILDDLRYDYQITYTHEIWVVKLNGFTCRRKIRKIKARKGVIHNKNTEVVKILPLDKFLEIDGKQIY